MRGALAAALAGALLMAGCMGDDDDAPEAVLVERDHARAAAVPITGGIPAQRRVLRSIVAGMGRTRITRIELAEAEAGWPAGDAVVFRTPDKDERGLWEAGLIGGIFRERSREQGLPEVTVVASRFGASNVARARPDATFRPFRPSDADEVVAGVERAADRSGADLERVELFQPAGLAVAIRLRARKPARFLAERLDTFFAELDAAAARYEGRYLEVVGPDGRPVLKEFSVSRLHWGGGGPAPRYGGCTFLGISRPIGYDPPPCPVED